MSIYQDLYIESNSGFEIDSSKYTQKSKSKSMSKGKGVKRDKSRLTIAAWPRSYV